MNLRRVFADALYEEMKKNNNIFVIVGDVGYKMWDQIREDFPDRFINTGAAEQAMIDLSIGLALKGKIPFVYSITTFLLYRPFESIRNYINYESIPVRLVSSGRDKDYLHEGFSHWSEEDKDVMKLFKNINSKWPATEEETKKLVKEMVKKNKPWYINLKR